MMLTPVGSDPSEWEGKYIRFYLSEDQPNKKTQIEEVCLGDIAEFLKWATHSHKHGI